VGCYFTIFFVVAKQTLNKLQTNPFLKAKPSPGETEKGLKPSMQLWANIPEANGNIVLSDSNMNPMNIKIVKIIKHQSFYTFQCKLGDC
jgi:hypothetical protein